MARNFRTVMRNGRPRRETDWFSVDTGSFNIGAASTATLFASLSASALAARPFTIVRTRLTWFCHSDQSIATEVWGGAIAMAVVSDQASASGVAAIPTPITDQFSDLFYVYDEQYGEFTFKTGVGMEEIGRVVKIDSKAMRKVNADQDVVLVGETPSFCPSMDSIIGGRMLIKLH